MTKDELREKLIKADTPYITRENQVKKTDGFMFSEKVLDWFSSEELKNATDIKLEWIQKRAGKNGWKISLI